MLDRAWPFPDGSHTAAAYHEAFSRQRSCFGGWRPLELVNDFIWFYRRPVIFMLCAKHIGLRLIPNAPLSAKELYMLAQMA